VTVTHPAPDHTTPGGATAGFFDGFVSGDKNACTFAAEGATPFCLLALQNTTSTFANFGVGQITIDGTRALVTVVGRFCVSQSGSKNCSTNSDPSVGQPGSSHRSFDTLYKTAVRGIAINKGAVPCERIKSEWYVSLAT
jgi:hypothetical protein